MIWVWGILTAGFSIVVLLKHVPQMKMLVEEYLKYREIEKNPIQLQAVAEMIAFSREYYQLSPGMENFVENIHDRFLKEALATFLGGAIRGHELLRGLRQKADAHYQRELAKVNDLRAHLRFLPAVGWAIVLATTGWLMSRHGHDNFIHHATTAFTWVMGSVFYGLAVSYLLIEPTIDRIEKYAEKTREKNIIIIESVSHLMRKQSAYEIFEAINLKLPSENKLNFQKFFPNADAVSEAA